MRILIATYSILFLLAASCSTAGVFSVKANMVVKIVDDNLVPVEGAEVKGSFINYPSNTEIKCTTDKEGVCVIEGGATNEGAIQVNKEGFYYSSLHFKFEKENRVSGRYEPWGKTYQIVLKKIRNPVPMYAVSRLSLKPPEYNKEIGFDLEKRDWVVPYGNGLEPDFIFNCNMMQKEFLDRLTECTLTFSREFDGIQEYFFPPEENSYYRWPFEAPVENYVDKLYKMKSVKRNIGSKDNFQENVNYIFRVRSKIDENGKIIDARYGKIPGDIAVDGGNILFSYYFNPDGTPNLEFDPNQNLFKFSRDEFMNDVQRP